MAKAKYTRTVSVECSYCNGTGKCTCELCRKTQISCLECTGSGWMCIQKEYSVDKKER